MRVSTVLVLLVTAVATAAQSTAAAAQTKAAEPTEVPSVLLTLSEEVEIPAAEEGVLAEVAVREGIMVQRDELLARVDDEKVVLQRERARIEMANARAQAENDVKVRYAEKSLELANAELQRAIDSLERYSKSISKSEVERLQLAADKEELEIEQARVDLQTAQFALEARESELAIADNDVKRRRIESPLAGMVVQINRRRGEWVTPGEPVMRIVRLDTLRAEGFLDAAQASGEMVGRRVTLHVASADGKTSDYTGTLTFVSPEISPFNGQVRVWAEIDNRELQLRPGQRASMTIELDSRQLSGDASD